MENIRKGDIGRTDSLARKNIKKDDKRIIALAMLDRLCAELGFAKTEIPALAESFTKIQNILIEIMGIISGSGKTLSRGGLDFLDLEIGRLGKELPPLKEFILPGNNKAEAILHLCRTCARVAETAAVAANAPQETLAFINRLSLYLFTLARAQRKI
ncbi:MAG: ATP:cob(I)alamin adenosyltransferase [Elusimicrobiota bacterium]|jgi:cob(I)alamin adenosyltransferase|nr:ATP:cob(I)alamin adenosyltransferase [Elusimicrobiota bacterium]